MTFDQVYSRLNQAQRAAVETIEGPVMVIAGPGTGKTQVLAARIAHILQATDTPPQGILALTFTDAAAQNMRERIVGMIGQAGYYVRISTFHAFASTVIQSHPEYFPIDRDSQPLTEVERYELFETIIHELDLSVIKPLNQPLYYVPTLISAISDLKREGISPDEFAQILEQEVAEDEANQDTLTKTQRAKIERERAKQHELLDVYQMYTHQLRASQRYDYDDMILLVADAFAEHEVLLRQYQEQLQYVLVDEYQDTNSAQNEIVDHLMSYWGEQANIFVVGDPHQSIYRFQGASIENALTFLDRYSQATIITLAKGYRCPADVYQVAHRLIGQNETVIPFPQLAEKLAVPLEASGPTAAAAKPLEIIEYPSQLVEVMQTARRVKQVHAEGTKWEEIAVLVRNNRDLEVTAEIFAKWDIPYVIEGGESVLDQLVIHQLLTFFSCIRDIQAGEEPHQLYEVLFFEWVGLDTVLALKLARVASKKRCSIWQVLQEGYAAFAEADIGQPVSEEAFAPLTEFCQLLTDLAAADYTMVFPAWFERAITDAGLVSWLEQHPQQIEFLGYLQALFNQAKQFSRSGSYQLSDFLRALEVMQEHRIRLTVDTSLRPTEAVKLTTAHKAKGQEWDVVFMLHVVDGKWGNVRHRELLPLPEGILKNTELSEQEQNEDERRLFYVGLTRAKKQVIVSYPKTLDSNGSDRAVVRSMFVEEVLSADETVQVQEEDLAPDQAQKELQQLLTPAPALKGDQQTRDYLFHVLENYKLSVTALNAYLRDPEEFLENYLLRVPRAKPEPMSFGTAVHTALERLGKHAMQAGQPLPERQFLQTFEDALAKELLTPDQHLRRLEYGRDILTTYYQQFDFEQCNPLAIERFFGTSWSQAVLTDVQLSGRVDRIDWISKEDKTVCVIDYKTGKTKSANFIEGNLKSMDLSERERALPDSIRGPYKRQLLFYKLLAELDPTFQQEVRTGVFEFVEPTKSGKIVRRQFDLPQSDVDDLKELIIEVMQEIRALTFL